MLFLLRHIVEDMLYALNVYAKVIAKPTTLDAHIQIPKAIPTTLELFYINLLSYRWNVLLEPSQVVQWTYACVVLLMGAPASGHVIEFAFCMIVVKESKIVTQKSARF